MSTLESSSLAGSAPSEQELLETLAEAIGEFERLAAEEPAKFRPANLLTAHQLRWLASALPGLLATARDGERLAAKRFPILDGPAIPWSAIAPFEAQAMDNHGQTLEGLAHRGGLSVTEALHVLECVRWHRDPRSKEITALSKRDAILRLIELTSPAAARSTGSVDNG